MQLTVGNDAFITRKLLTALGSNQFLRAPTPLTKDVSRVYPPTCSFRPSLPPLLCLLSVPSSAPLLCFLFLWLCPFLSVAVVSSPRLPFSPPCPDLPRPSSGLSPCGICVVSCRIQFPLSSALCAPPVCSSRSALAPAAVS